MLRALRLCNVGPAPELELTLAPRLNLITGDNGLGKSFLLDVAWWALTRKWPQDLNPSLTSGYAARPIDIAKEATIELEVESKAGVVRYESPYIPEEQAWKGKPGRPWNPGLVIYALADGGFAVWDPARNYWRKQGNLDVQERLPAYVFSSKDVWDGLRVAVDGKPTQVSNGLVADWASWIREDKEDAKRMAAVLALLAPTLGEDHVTPGQGFARLSVNDVRDIPTVRMGYGQDVPILYASLGVRRIAALAYMLSWAWREHLIASRDIPANRTSRVILLFDEVEAHLHPRWQRAIVPALLKVVQTLTDDAGAAVQLIAATHSPLVLASVEPWFEVDKDAWFDLDLEEGEVVLRHRPFVRQGDANAWLTSAAFDMGAPRSADAELMLDEAARLLSAPNVEPKIARALHQKLRGVLGDLDPFWERWRFIGAKQGWLTPNGELPDPEETEP